MLQPSFSKAIAAQQFSAQCVELKTKGDPNMSSMPNLSQQGIIKIIKLLFTQVAKGKGDVNKWLS
jgi:hypothetical protein